MQTLNECYKEIAQDDRRWSYYSNPPYSICGTWTDPERSYRFIRDYFNYAGKSEVFKDKYLERYPGFVTERAQHIISTFLLGIKITESFDIDINTRNDDNMNFLYYWFLTCLYHDIGYVYENDSNLNHLEIVKRDGIQALKEICHLEHVHQRIFQTYPYGIVDFYLKCRTDSQETQPKLDHGIVGGLLLYDKLRKQFKMAWKRRTDKLDGRNSFYVVHEGTGRRLHLSNQHYDAYAKAADAVIAHNIWTSTLREYIAQCGNTNQLPNINLNKTIDIDNTLCFILSLADTIEPLKRCPHYLDAIKIETIQDCKGFRIRANVNDFNSIYSKIKSLEDWITIKVDVENAKNNDKIILFTLPNKIGGDRHVFP